MTRAMLTDRNPGHLKVDAVVVGLVPQDKSAKLAEGHALPKAAVAHVESAITALDLKGKPEELTRLTGVPDVEAPLVLLIGLGDATKITPETLRRAAGQVSATLNGKQSVAFSLPGDSAAQAGAVAEGGLYGAYSFTDFLGEKAQQSAKAPVDEVHVCVDKPKDKAVKEAVETAEIMSRAMNWARDLVNTPPNALYPETFAQNVTAYAVGSSVDVQVMDEEELAAANCGGILGVGQGSARGPRMVVMRYTPRRAKKHIAIIGKGITFDSGGLCIKPPTGMITMKCDMAGAAATAAAVSAIAELGLPVQVTAYLCLAENMTGANAQRPGDVVTIHNGKTVEVLNTDAEGRMVMADGLALASDERPDVILDIATLTGAAVVALGGRTAAVLSNNEGLRTRIQQIGEEVGENYWPLPLAEEIRKTMDTPVADIKHIGTGAGCITAAVFLQEFVGETEDGRQIDWAHLDIAGPAFTESAYGYTPKGGTGFGVRGLVGIARDYAN